MTIARCVEVSQQEVRRLVALEFRAFSDHQALRVTVDCDRSGARLTVEDRHLSRRRTRSLALQQTPRPARARLIALAAAELAAAVLSEAPDPDVLAERTTAVLSDADVLADAPPERTTAVLADAPDGTTLPRPPHPSAASPLGSAQTSVPGEAPRAAGPSAPAASPPSPFSAAASTPSPPSWPRTTASPAQHASSSPTRSKLAPENREPDGGALVATPSTAPHAPWFRLLADVGGARFFSRLALTSEVGLTVRYEGWRLLEPAVALTGSFGSTTSNGRSASAASLSVAPLLGLHRRVGPLTARAATGPRLGLGRLQATAALAGDQPLTFTAPWLGWVGQLGLANPVGSRFAVELSLRGGYILSPIGGRIAGDRAIAVEGPWVGAALSLGALL